MQDIYKRIFDLATQDRLTLLQDFPKEEAVMYKGFKISRSKGLYKWEDTRYDNYYEQVDPKITENVLSKGFVETLNEVMHHNDLEKVTNINRDVEKIDAEVNFWTKESTRIWNEFNNKKKKINKDEIDEGKKKTRISALQSKYERDKVLFQKKRRVLAEEKEEIRKDLVFYETRIKMNKK